MNRQLRGLGIAAALTTATCGTTVIDEYEICALDLTLDLASGAPGTEIQVSGNPMTEVRDTRVEVGGVRATVVSVDREDCEACDTCRLEGGCPPCGLCAGPLFETNEEREACFGEPLADPPVPGSCDACEESMAFVVPEAAPGLTSVVIFNSNGQSAAIPFEVLPGPGTDSGSTADTAETADTSGTTDTSETADTGTASSP